MSERPLTEIEKRITELDATWQRSLSGELNGRAASVAGLFAVSVVLIFQSEAFGAFPILQTLSLVGFGGVAFLMFPIVHGEDYGYPKGPERWDARVFAPR